MKKKLIILSSLFLVPVLAFAQNATCAGAQSGTIGAIICDIGNILNSVIPVIIVLGVVYFIWGVVSYVISSDEEAKKAIETLNGADLKSRKINVNEAKPQVDR